MDDGLGKIKVISNHFKASTSRVDSHPSLTSSVSQPQIDDSSRYSNFFWEKRSVRNLEQGLEILNLEIKNKSIIYFFFIWFSIDLVAGLEEN